MKRFILLIAATAIAYVNNCQAQDFKQTLTATFATFDSSTNPQKKVEMSNKLSLIAKKWSSEWSAHYYNAYSKVMLSYNEQKEAQKDAYLDEAEKELGEAISLLGKETDETYVVAAMIANARLAVNPKERWMKYGKIYEDNLAKVKELNPENPRLYYIQGTNKLFTPKQWGGGKKVALPYFEKAKPLFEKEKTDDIAVIHWGSQANEYFIGQCKIEDKE